MTMQELKSEKRANQQVVNTSCTLKAQLKALNTDAGYNLKVQDKDGNVTDLHVTKREQLKKFGLLPHYVGKSCQGYTPATFDAAVASELKEIGTDGKTKATLVYVERNVTVTVQDNEGKLKDEPVYTSEEADKKVNGEAGAKACKLYFKVTIGQYGWSPRIIMKVLEQSRTINDEQKREQQSREKFLAQKEKGLYIVVNVNGKLVKKQVKSTNNK